MKPQEIIRKPLDTEKGRALNEKHNVYLFEVNKRANKLEIKMAVEALFGVKVSEVRTVRAHGKKVRRGLNVGVKNDNKKAYVTLAEGNKIALFEGV